MNKEALQKVIDGTRDERAFLCEHDFSLFFAYYFTEYIHYPFAPFHYEMFKDLKDLEAGKYREIAWVMFRESAKTSIAKAFIVWCIVFTKRRYINTDSFDKENSERILFDVVTTLQLNKRLVADYGQLYNAKRNKDETTIKRVSNFVTNNGVRVEAHSTQESVRGRIHKDQRPDFFILDDIETNKTRDSKAYTEQVMKHISELLAGLAPNAWVIYLGNYITEAGSIQSLIDRAQEDHKLKLRMVPVMLEDSTPTWDQKYAITDEIAELTGKVSIEDKKRQLGSVTFAAEMMNQPIDDETTEFKKEFQTFIPNDTVMKRQTRCFISIDTAVSEKASADFTGITVNFVDVDNHWNLKAWKVKCNPRELIDLLFTMYHTHKPEKIGIEKTIYLQAIKPFLDEEMRVRNTFMPIVELQHNSTAKETRIRGLIARYETKSIVFIENECNDLLDEMRTFPRGLHDDVLDSLAYQQQLAQAPYRESYDEKLEQKEIRERNTQNYAR